MKTIKILSLVALFSLISSCSEAVMDEINKERNDATQMKSNNILTDAIIKTAYETLSTDLAWYSSVYIEHNAGTWGQHESADKRIGQNVSSTFNNSWNNLYRVMASLKIILKLTAPNGPEKDNYGVRGVAYVLMAINLATATDMWGEVPYEQAALGREYLKPTYERQSELYPKILAMLDSAIMYFDKTPMLSFAAADVIYSGNVARWKKLAYSLKARYLLRIHERSSNKPQNLQNILAACQNGFSSATEQAMFSRYENKQGGYNPWVEMWRVRDHFSTSLTLFEALQTRNDPRLDKYVLKKDGTYKPVLNGGDVSCQGCASQSALSTGFANATRPTPIMTFHELKFIEAEARYRLNPSDTNSWAPVLRDAIRANFAMHGLTQAQADAYFTNSVLQRLASNALKEIIYQKWLAQFEFEAIEAYNDYRRTQMIDLKNPYNQTVGFVWRLPYPTSEISANSANVPQVNVFQDKVWWAGGDEKF